MSDSNSPAFKQKRGKRKHDEESIESRSTDGSDDGEDLKGFLVDEEDDDTTSTPQDEEKLALEEAKKFAGEIAATTAGKYSLRDRSKIRKVEVYFDAENAAIITRNQDKNEMLQLLKEWRASKEYIGEIEMKKSSTYEQVLEEYTKAKAALQLPDSDIEDDEEGDECDDEEEDEDEEEDDDEDQDEDEDDEDEDEDEDEDDEDEDDEDEDDEDEDDEDEEDEDEEEVFDKDSLAEK